MSEISSMPSNIVEWLKSSEQLSYIRFMTEYPAEKKAVPLKNIIVAVGIGNIEIVDSFTENDEGVLVENEYCRKANIKLKFSIHAPFSSGGSACHEAFTDIIDCLTFDSELDIVSSGCDSIVADRDTDAFVLTAWLQVNASLCPAATSSVVLPSFLNKELLCGSHINNADIHLTAEEKSFLGSPYVLGTYFGRGEASFSIQLGFEPKFVFVCARNAPFMETGAEFNTCLAAAAAGSGATHGIEIFGNGFRVKNTTEAFQGAKAMLNEAGTTYFYVALK